ncbi:MAG: MATE family efflux transporter [Lachnospiraceae bacterium]|nr:MATE family efflux transporter [Lachnospiraceae bacterium]
MRKRETFKRTVMKIALPVTLQSLLQSSFSVIDQIMIGKLGSYSIAGIGLGGKFASLYSVVLGAIASAAGIMISQYIGSKDAKSVSRSFFTNLAFSIGLAVAFLIFCIAVPEFIMGAYTKDEVTRSLAANYLRILAVSFLPMAVSSIVTTMLRCMEAAALPLYASIFALVLNTGLNYLLIFGKWIFPEMGVEGAALASVIAQTVSCVMILIFFARHIRRQEEHLAVGWIALRKWIGRNTSADTRNRKQYLKIIGPMLLCEFMWSLGENIYTAIYGHIGTDACAAMTMTIPVQTLLIGALSGLSQAAGILIGKSLGAKQFEKAYQESKKLLKYGLVGSVILSVALIIASPFYVKIYSVKPLLHKMTGNLLIAFAVIAPVKVLNMILGGGIIRSGGKTDYVMWIDLIGTWLFGVPLGLLAGFVWNLPIEMVYFVLSLEECVRLGIAFILFRRKIWMESL